MILDTHFTTCHHTGLKCRPRTNDYNIDGFNITPWTQEEKLNIAKISLESLKNFVGEEKITIIDDGSNIQEAVDWMLEQDAKGIFVRFCEKKGSSAGVNTHFNHIPKDTDLIFHCEDDHIWWNPENLNWKQIVYEYLKENKDVGVVTFRSGLPSNPSDPDYSGAWGPVGFREGKVPAILYNCMGNAHHLMLYETYSKFFPLQGNAGSCEAYMNGRLQSLRLLNAELQIPMYAFHSHCFSRSLPEKVTTTILNKSPRGIEYGVQDMYEHIINNRPIEYSYFKNQTEEIIKCYP